MDLLSISRVAATSDRLNVNLGGNSWVTLRKDILPELAGLSREVWMSAHADQKGLFVEFGSHGRKRISVDGLLQLSERLDSKSGNGSDSGRVTRNLTSAFGEGIAAV